MSPEGFHIAAVGEDRQVALADLRMVRTEGEAWVRKPSKAPGRVGCLSFAPRPGLKDLFYGAHVALLAWPWHRANGAEGRGALQDGSVFRWSFGLGEEEEPREVDAAAADAALLNHRWLGLDHLMLSGGIL